MYMQFTSGLDNNVIVNHFLHGFNLKSIFLVAVVTKVLLCMPKILLNPEYSNIQIIASN